ncbi:MAG TPA: hypothetical protein VGO67_08750 [Verrucomicrobiae bacterium]
MKIKFMNMTAIPQCQKLVVMCIARTAADFFRVTLGWALDGGRTGVALSDCCWISQEDGLQVTRSYCIVQGHNYWMRALDERLQDEKRAASAWPLDAKRGDVGEPQKL